MTATLAALGTACAADYGETEGAGEAAVDSIEQALLPTTGLQLKVTVGNNGLASGGQVYADVRYMGAAPQWFALNSGAWPANSTQTISLPIAHPEDVYDVFLQYGGFVPGDRTDTWNISGLTIQDIRNGALSTRRFALGWDIGMSSISHTAYLPMPNVLLLAPVSNLPNKTENFYFSYKTWDGTTWCASVKNNEFTHAPWTPAYGCNWRNAHEDTGIHYQSWDGSNWWNWRASVNTSTMLFTQQRMSGPAPIPAPHASTNLRYRATSNSFYQVVIKPWT